MPSTEEMRVTSTFVSSLTDARKNRTIEEIAQGREAVPVVLLVLHLLAIGHDRPVPTFLAIQDRAEEGWTLQVEFARDERGPLHR